MNNNNISVTASMTQPVTNIEGLQTPVVETGSRTFEQRNETPIETKPTVEVNNIAPTDSVVVNRTQEVRQQFPINDTLGQPTESVVNGFAQILGTKNDSNSFSLDIRAIQKN